MIKKLVIPSVLIVQLCFPVTLDIANERNERTAARMVDALKAYSEYAAEVLTRNDDEEDFATDRRANFGKGLAYDPLSATGTFHKTEYDKLLTALDSEDEADFEALTGGTTPPQPFKLVNPLGLFATDFSGADGWLFAIPSAPTLTSAESAGEMVEVYWHAVLRDIPFNKYSETDASPLVQERAITELNTLTDFVPKTHYTTITGGNLFRGTFPGEDVGPYVSQFLYQPVPNGPAINTDGSGSSAPFDTPSYQEVIAPTAGNANNFMMDESEWQTIQEGGAPSESTTFDETRRYFIRNARDLAEYVHYDWPGKATLNAALMLLSYGSAALDDNFHYASSDIQAGFVTFGPGMILGSVLKVAELALKAAWFQKWYVHRRLRPEVYGYLIEHEGTLSSGLHSDITGASVFTDAAFLAINPTNKLLPMAYPEGSPTHPAYPAGHATFIGATVTLLKAFFKDDFVIPTPVEPNSDNDDLITWTGADLEVGAELNKLASNISIGRNMAGVHYRTDGTEGMLLGEKVAIKFLNDIGLTLPEGFTGFSLKKFDGTTITVGAKV